jgi:hypothetical protein
MLRVSGRQTDRPIDLRAVIDPACGSGLDAGHLLLAFAEAAVSRDHQAITDTRAALLEAVGEAATVRAAAVTGTFEMMNRLLDAVGVRLRGHGLRLAEELGLDVPDHLVPG